MDEIENKFQLEIINVNKIIANKKREIESKAISGQITSNHHTRVTQRERLWDGVPITITRANCMHRQKMAECEANVNHFLFFLFVQN